MNIKKILIVSLFLLILANIAIGTSYAESNEKIKVTSKNTDSFITYEKKIVSIDYEWDSGDIFKVNIKKKYQKNYKIKSVKVKYSTFNETGEVFTVFKTYNGKNKVSLTFKAPENHTLDSMTVYYQTKNEPKKESMKNDGSYKSTTHSKLVGKKSNIDMLEKGNFYGPNYLKITVKTTSYKNTIKALELIYYMEDDEETGDKQAPNIIKFKGNGKTTFTKELKGDIAGIQDEVKVTYV